METGLYILAHETAQVHQTCQKSSSRLVDQGQHLVWPTCIIHALSCKVNKRNLSLIVALSHEISDHNVITLTLFYL